MQKGIFDLDLQINKMGSQGSRDRITSISLCTPGTCNNTCKGNTTLHSDCCPDPTTITWTTSTAGTPATTTTTTTTTTTSASIGSCFCNTQRTC